jgi:hypothetical protein
LQTVEQLLVQQEELIRLHSVQLQRLAMERAWRHDPPDHEQGVSFPEWNGSSANVPVAIFLAVPM